jgi:hypothetical protein
MKQHQFLKLNTSWLSGLGVSSTDAEILNWIEVQVKNIAPKCKKKQERFLPSGERYFLGLELPPGIRDEAIGWWVLRQLCEQGWGVLSAGEYVYYLQREVNSQPLA